MRINKTRDWIERVGWTTIQAAAAAVITALTTKDLDWLTGVRFVATAAVIAALKVLAAQNFGGSGDGAAIPGGVTE